MVWKVLLAGVGVVVAIVIAGVVVYQEETEPIEKRGSAKEEFDPSAAPDSPEPPTRASVRLAWPTFGFDPQRNKNSPYRHRPPYRRTWRIDAHDTIEFPPSAAYGNLYLAQQKGLFFAIDGKTGRKVFRRKNFRRCAASSPTISRGMVYQSYMHWSPCPQGASNPTGFVTAMSAKTGKEKWRFRRGPFESSPLIRKGIVYVGNWDNNVYAISARTGRKIWSFKADDKVNTSAAYSKGRIYIASNGGTLYSLGARSGRLYWKAQSQARLGRREFFYASPTVAYGRVFIGNTDGTMYAFGQKTGRLRWARPIGTYIYSSAAIHRQRVYVGTYDGGFYALHAATGDTMWRREMPSAVHASPVVMGGLVYATTCSSCGSAASRRVKQGKDKTYGLNILNGRTRWRNNGGKYASAVIADQDRVYFTGRSRQYALEPESKKARAKRLRRRAERRERRAERRKRRADRRRKERR